MSNHTVPAAAEGMLNSSVERLALLAYEARMAARAADYLASDILAEQRPSDDGPRVVIKAIHADLVMHAVERARICIETLEDAIERFQYGSSEGSAR